MKRRSWYGAGSLILLMLMAVSLPGCSTKKEEPSFVNPLDPETGKGIPVPDSASITVGDHVVHLRWRLPEPEVADEFAVFRRRTDQGHEEQERLLNRVTPPEYTDTEVRNGATYAYRIAAGVGGHFGDRTEDLEARPGLFTILLSNGDALAHSRTISVAFSIPRAEAIRIFEDPDESTRSWQVAASPIQWTLNPGDGTKTVYARFRFVDGSESLPVSDTIRLDTKAAIQSVGFTGAAVRRPGEVIHFRIITGEAQGSARITVAEVFASVALFDDGTDGDAVANDGTYERDLTIPVDAAILDQQVLGEFTDEAGNQAANVTAPQLLSVRRGPDPVALLAPLVSEPPDAPSVTLRWEFSLDHAFSAYRLFRLESAQVDSTSKLVETISSSATLQFDDGNVTEGKTYYYRVYVRDSRGMETGSNTVRASVPNLRSPTPVTLQTPTATSTTRIVLGWSKSSDLDFRCYRVFRNESGAVSDVDTLLTEVSDVSRIFWENTGLTENTTYYYRVYVVDQGGLSAPSNEVEGSTKDEAPLAVTLNEASSIDTTSATLSWEESSAHDFAFYRLYRDEIATVTTASPRVVEMDQIAFTSFRDMALKRGTRYYYRVFVVDDADPAKSTGSNTITLVTQ